MVGESNQLLPIALSVAVPLWIMQLEEKGGPTKEDFENLKETENLIAAHGDELLYRSKKEGRTAELFNKTAKAIAVLSFCPGGINIFNQHFEGKFK